ncbi:MAG: hypothetical protein HQM08_29765 [Candidatus Riflebacteria bacterium]|nr:hypothetical protein [Candidatus Riflebacteria bacterium]
MINFPQPTPHVFREILNTKGVSLWQLKKLLKTKLVKEPSESQLSSWLRGKITMPNHVEEAIGQILKEMES